MLRDSHREKPVDEGDRLGGTTADAKPGGGRRRRQRGHGVIVHVRVDERGGDRDRSCDIADVERQTRSQPGETRPVRGVSRLLGRDQDALGIAGAALHPEQECGAGHRDLGPLAAGLRPLLESSDDGIGLHGVALSDQQ